MSYKSYISDLLHSWLEQSQKVAEVKRLIPSIVLAVTLAELVPSDADTFLADSNISENEINTGQVEMNNSLVGATITIAMYATLNE